MVKDNKDIIEEALKRFDAAKTYSQTDYARGSEDVKFVFGDQWDESALKTRKSDGRPSLVENHCLPFVHQVVNSVRQANPSITVQPVDDKADVETAEILQGMVRNIEVRSSASDAYDLAVWNSASFSRGWIRVNTEYVHGSFDQDIVIDRVLNPESVYIDPNHTKQDGSDAEYLFIFDDMDKREFESKYPDANTEGFEGCDVNWLSDDSIRVAEYYAKEYSEVTLINTELGVFEEKDLPEGVEELDRRVERQCKVKWYKITATEILEETEWEGLYIPVIPVYGVESWVDGKRQVFSLINQARNPQQMLNYWRSASVELIALQPKTPYVGKVGQFETDADKWADANNRNYSFIEYDDVESDSGMPTPPPQRQPAPQGSMAMMQEASSAIMGIKSSLGMHDAMLGMQGNEVSGSAIKQRKMQGDNATFHYIDNLGVALKHVGRILVDLIPKIYTGARVARIIGEDGTPSNVPVNQPYMKNDKGNLVPVAMGANPVGRYDLDLGKYDVVVDVGASYSTRRQESVNSMLEVAAIDPRLMEVASDIFFENLDIPNGKELAKRMKMLVDPKFLQDDPMAAELQQAGQAIVELQKQLEDMQMALAIKEEDTQFNNSIKQQEIDIKKEETNLKAQELALKAAKAGADIDKIQAETASIKLEDLVNITEAIEELSAEVKDIAGAVDVILSVDEEGNLQPSEIIASNPSMEQENE